MDGWMDGYIDRYVGTMAGWINQTSSAVVWCCAVVTVHQQKKNYQHYMASLPLSPPLPAKPERNRGGHKEE